jgi:hypothetical protein
MAWISEPLTLYTLLGTGLILCLTLFVSLKRENTKLRLTLEKDRRLTVGKMEEFRSSMIRLQSALDQAQAETKTYSPVESGGSQVLQSVNLNKRSLALRMHRRGETPEQISASLSIPRNEVDLLLKVHKSVLEEA